MLWSPQVSHHVVPFMSLSLKGHRQGHLRSISTQVSFLSLPRHQIDSSTVPYDTDLWLLPVWERDRIAVLKGWPVQHILLVHSLSDPPSPSLKLQVQRLFQDSGLVLQPPHRFRILTTHYQVLQGGLRGPSLPGSFHYLLPLQFCFIRGSSLTS